MPAYHDSIDFQMCDRIFDYTSSIQIIRMHRIRDIAMDKYLSRLAVTHSRFGMRLSAQPIHRISGAWSWARSVKALGSRAVVRFW